jgi:hypothetical protein
MADSTTPTTAIDLALQLGARAATRLEYTAKPTLKDKKDARDYYKRAAKVLDSAVGLEEEDVYETGPRPDPVPEVPAPGVPLPFDGAAAQELPELPLELLVFPNLSGEDQEEAFDSLLSQLCDRSESDGAEVNTTEWLEAFKKDRKAAYTALHVAMREGAEHTSIPTGEEIASWLAQYASAEPEMAPADAEEPFELRPPGEQQQLFDAALDQLEEAGVAAGLRRKAWPASEAVWRALWAQDRPKAWAALQRAIDLYSWDVPAEDGGEK